MRQIIACPEALLRVAALVVLLLLAGCGRPPHLIGAVNPAIPVESVPDVTRHRIFITSTREASEVVGAFFGPGRAPQLGLASVDVTVPPTHVVGELERPRRLPPDPRTEFTIIDPVVYGSERAFIAEIDRALLRRPPGQRRLMLFVHGYNTSTSDALLRLGQFVEDTRFEGVPVLFTWASGARIPLYVYDLNSALIARVMVKDLAGILGRTRAESVDIFAHSMGTLLTMEGLVDAQLSGTLGTRATIDTVMLASPDIDIDLFRTQASLLPRWLLERMYLLISTNDFALRVSRRIAGGVPRVGAANAAELERLGVTIIDLSEIADSSSGSHSKFAGSPEVVQLIGNGLNAHGRFGDGVYIGLTDILAGAPIRIIGN